MAGGPNLKPHPRLFIGPDALARAKRPPRLPLLRRAAEAVAEAADAYAASADFEWRRNTHNAHLGRARTARPSAIVSLDPVSRGARWRCP